MSNVIIFDRIQLRQGTAADLAAVNEVLLDGEPCVETDTGKYKIGRDGLAWNDLAYQGIWSLSQLRAALDFLGSTAEGDLIYKGAAGWTRLPKGADGEVLTLASGIPSWAVGGGGSAFDPTTSAQLVPFTDCMGAVGGAPWVATLLGTGSATQINGGSGAPGVWQLGTGNSASAQAAVAYGPTNNVVIGGGEIVVNFRFRIPILGTASERLYVQAGLRDAWDAGASNNRIQTQYVDNINGGALQLICYSGGATTTSSGSTVLVANTWYRGKIVIAADASTAKLYLNDALEATVSSGLPSVALRCGALIGKSVGSTARTLDLDYFEAMKTFTVPR